MSNLEKLFAEVLRLPAVRAALRPVLAEVMTAVLAEMQVVATPAAPTPVVEVPPAEFARLHSISVSTVRKAITDGRLQASRIGRMVRIAADAKIATPNRASVGTVRSTTVAERADRIFGLVRGGKK